VGVACLDAILQDGALQAKAQFEVCKPPSPVLLGLQNYLSAWKGSARGGVRPPLAQAWQFRFEKLILKSAPKVRVD